MKIDGNELIKREISVSRAGRKMEAYEIRKEFLRQVKEEGNHCNCSETCPHHANCMECVVIHRGHRDHLPYCFRDMVNQRLVSLSLLTEGSFISY